MSTKTQSKPASVIEVVPASAKSFARAGGRCAKSHSPNPATIAAMRDVAAGRTTRFSSPQELFASWGK